jgi:hypothetical protein
MTDNRLSIRIGGKGEDIDAQALLVVLEETVALLRDLDSRMNDGQHTVRWMIESASKNSPFQGGLRGDVMAAASGGHAMPITDELIASFSELEIGAGRPKYFTDAMLDRAKRISGVVGKRVSNVTYTHGSAKPVSVTGFTAANAVKYQMPDAYSAYGEIEGRLDQITSHEERTEFCIYDPLTKRAIACEFDPDDLKAVLEAMNKRVRVSGLVVYKRKDHEPRRVRVDHWRTMTADADIPTIQAVHDLRIDLTRGRPSEEVIRALRVFNA